MQSGPDPSGHHWTHISLAEPPSASCQLDPFRGAERSFHFTIIHHSACLQRLHSGAFVVCAQH